jgi:hypothetical protein
MSTPDNKYNAAKFRLIAALAEDIAEKLARSGVWPGDMEDAEVQIMKALGELAK